MFIHRSQYFLIDYNLIFLSQFSNPFLFEHILIIGNHQRLDIRILLRSLFQDLSISCIYRILLERFNLYVPAEHLVVNQSVIPHLDRKSVV